MSKSLDNYISLDDSPTDMFGKLMSISDDLMIRYYNLLCRRSSAEVESVITGIKDGSKHPMEAKKELAVEIVNYYHADFAGEDERKKFEERFSKNKIPDDIMTVKLDAGELKLLDFLRDVEFIKSNGEGRRLFKQNAFKIDGKAFKEESFTLESGAEYILKLGKLRMVKIITK